ncbi:GNAT family N-acetyltransferase [Breoghania sp. JC706]|uniref:GNAT family N-acetyltransferase n=1 Tax=Breoghania sp. JC706 TaxID=3117732 RepID=UPI003008898C
MGPMVVGGSESGNVDAACEGGDPAPEANRLRVDNYDAVARRITPADRPLLHELTVSVFWPHRTRDLDEFLALGEGYLATDEIGRAMGSAMHYFAGDDFAMLGMMVTAPRLQTLGTGRWLLGHIMADAAGRDMRLSATRSGYWLYETEGFVPLVTIWQHQGIARPFRLPSPVPGLTVRTLQPDDWPALRVLDKIAFGAERTKTLDLLAKVASGVVVERDGGICGYALIRSFGRGKVIGPVIAEDDATAMMLVAPLIKAHEGEFVRLDTPVESKTFEAFLSAGGLGVYDTVTEMYYGRQRRPLEGLQIYGLAAHSLG